MPVHAGLGLAIVCATVAGAAFSEASAVQIVRTQVASGLRHPWSIAFLPDRRLLVTEKDGDLRIVEPQTGEHRVVAGFPGDHDNVRRNDPRDNSGLFDVLLHPQFRTNSLV